MAGTPFTVGPGSVGNANDYARSIGAPSVFMDQPVNYTAVTPNANWNQNGQYQGLGLYSDIYGATNGLNFGQPGFMPTDMGNYVGQGVNGSFSLNSGIVHNDQNSISSFDAPNGAMIAMWNGGTPGQSNPYAIGQGYTWQNGQIVADPNSYGGSFDASGNFVPTSGDTARYSDAQLNQIRQMAHPAGHAAAVQVGPPATTLAGGPNPAYERWQAMGSPINPLSVRQPAQGGNMSLMNGQYSEPYAGSAPSYGGPQTPTSPYGATYGGAAGRPNGIMYANGGTNPGMSGNTGIVPPSYSTPSAPSAPYTNPYLASQIANLGQQYGQQFQRFVMPSIRDSAIANGGYGGTAQGVAEGIAAGDMMNNFGNAATGLLANDWTNAQNRQLTNQGQMLSFASDQRAQDRADLGMGMSMYDMGVNGPWNPINNANKVYGSYTGFPTTTTSQGGGAMGAVGGAMGVYGLGKQMGWW